MIGKIFGVSFLHFVIKLVSALLVLATQIVISRYYHVQDLATWSKLVNYFSIATVASGLGLNVSAIYYLRKKMLPVEFIFTAGYLSFFVLSFLIFIILMIAGVETFECVLIALFSMLNNAFFLHNAIAQANGDYRKFNIQNLAYASINLIAIMVIYISSASFSIYHILLVQCICLAILTLLNHKGRANFLHLQDLHMMDLRTYFNYGSRIFLTNMLGILLYSGDVILLDVYLPDNQLAVYLLAATAVKLLWMGIDSMGLVIYPEFVSASNGESNRMNHDLLRIFMIMSGIIVTAFLFFLVGGQFIVRWIYGSAFMEVYGLLLLLIIATMGVMFYKFLGRYFAAIEQWNIIYISLIAGILLNWMLIVILVPIYGVTGAALASLGAYVTTGLIITWYYAGWRKKLEYLPSE